MKQTTISESEELYPAIEFTTNKSVYYYALGYLSDYQELKTSPEITNIQSNPDKFKPTIILKRYNTIINRNGKTYQSSGFIEANNYITKLIGVLKPCKCTTQTINQWCECQHKFKDSNITKGTVKINLTKPQLKVLDPIYAQYKDILVAANQNVSGWRAGFGILLYKQTKTKTESIKNLIEICKKYKFYFSMCKNALVVYGAEKICGLTFRKTCRFDLDFEKYIDFITEIGETLTAHTTSIKASRDNSCIKPIIYAKLQQL